MKFALALALCFTAAFANIYEDSNLKQDGKDVKDAFTCDIATSLISRTFGRKESCMMVAGVPTIEHEKSALKAVTSCADISILMSQYGLKVGDCVVVAESSNTAYFRVDNLADWQGSWTACHALAGGDMATVRNIGEHMATVKLVQSMNQTTSRIAWMGLTDMDVEGTWRWVDNGEQVGYNKWFPGEPNNCCGSQVNCGTIASSNGNIGWDDYPCSQLAWPFCKLPM